jgi:hypothetical protein
MPVRIFVSLAALFLLGLQPAFAEDVKPSEESIRHLFEVMNTRHLLDDMMGQMDKTMRESARTGLGGASLNPQQQQIFDDMMTKLVAMMKEQMSWQTLEPMMISVYRGAGARCATATERRAHSVSIRASSSTSAGASK